jgi:hypothetical protein
MPAALDILSVVVVAVAMAGIGFAILHFTSRWREK